MKTIKVKFYRVTKYTDPTGHFKIEMTLGLVGTEIMGKMMASCDNFPSVTTIMGPFDPTSIEEIQNELREEEKKGRIKNLTFEDEIEGIGIPIKVTPEQIQMN